MKIAELTKLARKWGGDVIEVQVDAEFPNDVEGAPFSHYLAINYELKRVYWKRSTGMMVHDGWCGIIHEMGHVFASREPPNDSNEWSFFGWEYAVARQIGCVKAWVKANSDYRLDDGDEFGTLPRQKRQAILQKRLLAAKCKGLIINGKPVAIR